MAFVRAFDDRPQAHRYPVSDFSYLFLFRRRTIRFTDSHPPTDAWRLSGYARNLQQAVHDAWRSDDFLFSDSFDSSVLGNFVIPIMIGAKDLAFPKINY